MWVVDSSLALALLLPDESSPLARRFFLSLSSRDVLWVPALWWYEVANAVTSACRRKRVSETDATQIFLALDQLPLETDAASGGAAAGRIAALAREHALSAYDAAYLELAQRRDAGLATLDERLNSAARSAGVSVIG